mgnify:CR=1 FL=1
MQRTIDFYVSCTNKKYGVELIINGTKFEAYSDCPDTVQDVYLHLVDEIEAVYGIALYSHPVENDDILFAMVTARNTLANAARLFRRVRHDGNL